MDGRAALPGAQLRGTEGYRSVYSSWRTRAKDRFVHPYSAAYWDNCFGVDRISRDELLALQASLLQGLVDHAVRHVPFYQRWARGVGYRVGDVVRLGDLPVVSKDDIRADLEAFQSGAYPLEEMRTSKTSGSSGQPFMFRVHRESVDYTYCCLWRALARYGLRVGDRRAYVWGRGWQFSTRGRLAVAKVRARLAARNWLNRTHAVDAYDLSERTVAGAYAGIEAYGPAYLHGYVSSLYTIAAYMLAEGKQLPGRVKVVVTESEKLYDFQRRAIEGAFGCPVVENYGSVEFGLIASQDLAGRLRVNDDMHLVERLPTGEAVITNLRARAFPFIRYKLGDLIEMSPPGMARAGGLPYSVLDRVVGRTVDLIPVAGGGYVHGVALAHVIDPHLAHVHRYQIHQTEIDRFVVRLTLRSPLPEEARRRIVADLKAVAGAAAQVKIEVVDHIAPAASGKFRWVVSDVSDVARQAMVEEGSREMEQVGVG